MVNNVSENRLILVSSLVNVSIDQRCLKIWVIFHCLEIIIDNAIKRIN